MTGCPIRFVAVIVAALFVVAGCSDAPKRSAPPIPAPVESGEPASTPDDPPAKKAAPDGPPKKAPKPVTGTSSEDQLALAAGLDTPLMRRIRVWDREVEAGLVRQAEIRSRGRVAMDAEVARLQEARQNGTASLVDLYLLGRMLGKLDRVDEARAIFRNALERDRDFLYAHEGMALCVGQRITAKTVGEVRAHLDRAFDIWGDFPRGLLVLGQIQMQEPNAEGKVDPRKALATFGRIPRDHPAYEFALIGICDCLIVLKKYDVAIVKLREAIRRHPERTEWRVQLAAVQIAAGKHEEAEAVLRGVLTREPRQAGAQFHMARLLALRGDFAGSANLYMQVRDNHANPRAIRQAAIRGLERLKSVGRRPPSLEEILKVLESHPDASQRREASWALYVIGRRELSQRRADLYRHPDILQVIEKKLSVETEADEGVRVNAVRFYGTVLSEKRIERLTRLLDPKVEPSRLVRGAVAACVGGAHPDRVPFGALILALEDPEPYVFRQARRVLRNVTGEHPCAELTGELTPEERARVAAAWQAWYGKRQASRKVRPDAPAKKG